MPSTGHTPWDAPWSKGPVFGIELGKAANLPHHRPPPRDVCCTHVLEAKQRARGRLVRRTNNSPGLGKRLIPSREISRAPLALFFHFSAHRDVFVRLFFVIVFYLLATPRGLWDLSSPPRMEPVPPALEAWSLNHWTAREFPKFLFS